MWVEMHEDDLTEMCPHDFAVNLEEQCSHFRWEAVK